MNTFTINEKEYKARAFDFELVCDLEDMGIEISEIGQNSYPLFVHILVFVQE